MEIVRFLKFFAVGMVFFISLDFVWINLIMNKGYKTYLKPIARKKNGELTLNLFTSLLVWMLIVFGMLIFVYPKIEISNGLESFLWGGIYGFIVYGIYDLTNYSILEHWPLALALIDIGWGTFANGALAYVFYLLRKLI